MCHVICITNLKGGSGKTTTAVNLSASLAVAEKQTLLIDCDPQANATVGMGIDKTKLKKNLYHAMMDNAISNDIILDTELKFLKILPSRIELLRTDIKLASQPGKEKILYNMLSDIKNQYDYIIIDSSPSWGLLNINAFSASDSFLVPLPCEFYAFKGIGNTLQTVKLIKQNFNPDLKMAGILLTLCDETELSQQIIEAVKTHFKDKIFKTIIPRDISIRESPGFGRPLLCQNIQSCGAKSYLKLANEIMDAE
ncbi:Chromosome partitioning protein ParA [Candidatus Magnetomoraceae bacterium gMMP-15]